MSNIYHEVGQLGLYESTYITHYFNLYRPMRQMLVSKTYWWMAYQPYAGLYVEI
jgi:hypothetical protein